MTTKRMAHNIIARLRLQECPFSTKIPTTRRINAATIEEILDGLNSKVTERSGDVTVRLADNPFPFEWEFMATSGNDKYTVSVRAHLKEGQEAPMLVSSADVILSCSCPFWRWQGPEYHAKDSEYLYGSPRGSASSPDVRDPGKSQYVCKHAAKVLETLRTYTIGEM